MMMKTEVLASGGIFGVGRDSAGILSHHCISHEVGEYYGRQWTGSRIGQGLRADHGSYNDWDLHSSHVRWRCHLFLTCGSDDVAARKGKDGRLGQLLISDSFKVRARSRGWSFGNGNGNGNDLPRVTSVVGADIGWLRPTHATPTLPADRVTDWTSPQCGVGCAVCHSHNHSHLLLP